MNALVFANIPHDCHEDELRRWVEEKGFIVTNLRMIRDTVSGSSPAFARIELASRTPGRSAVELLNRQEIRGQRVLVRPEARLSS